MANSVTFPTEYGGSGITITDDADPTTGLDGTGYIERFVPALQQTVVMTGHAVQKAGEADSSAQTATSAAQQASADRDSINLDLQTLNGLVSDADASATAAAGSATTASNMADAVAQATATYTSVSAGLADTVDTNYFRVIEAPEAERVSVYRNDAGSATLITTYYTKTGVDARQAATVRLNRSLQRLGDNGQTLHSDFAYAAYGLGSRMSGGVDQALKGEELWQVERVVPKWELGPDGYYRQVSENVLARRWDFQGKPAGVAFEPRDTGSTLYSNDFLGEEWMANGLVANSTAEPSAFKGYTAFELLEKNEVGRHQIEQNIGVGNEGDVVSALFVMKAKERSIVKIRVGREIEDESVDINLMTGEVTRAGTRVLKHKSFISASGFVSAYIRVSLGQTSSMQYQNIMLGDGTGEFSYVGDGSSGIYIAHAQHWKSGRFSTPIVTTDAPTVRTADNVKKMLGNEWNPREGTFVWEGAFTESDEIYNYLLFVAASETTAGGIWMGVRHSMPDSLGRCDINIRTSIAGTLSVYEPVRVDERIKFSVSYSAGKIKLCVNGRAVNTVEADTSFLAYLKYLKFGGASSESLIDYTSGELIYHPYEMTDQQHQEATA